MAAVTLALALLLPAQGQPATDARTVFALMERYHSSFQDVTFLHQGADRQGGRGVLQSGQHESVPVILCISERRGYSRTSSRVAGEWAGHRTVRSVLKGQLEIFDASPDYGDPIRERSPVAAGRSRFVG